MSIPLVSTDPPPLSRGQRGHARARIRVPARLITLLGTSACVVLDVSQTGARIAAADGPKVGAPVMIGGLSPELFGTVQWRYGDQLGMRFDAPLTVEEVVALRRYGDAEPERTRSQAQAHARRWVTGQS